MGLGTAQYLATFLLSNLSFLNKLDDPITYAGAFAALKKILLSINIFQSLL